MAINLNSVSGAFSAGAKDVSSTMEDIYTLQNDNWHQALPYGFRFGSATFYLPISPSNINVTTHFATNTVTTLFSTVEEHSEVRYYDIVIEGTTGMAPKYMDIVENDPNTYDRHSFEPLIDLTGALGGFAAKTLGIANQIANKAQELADVFGGPTNPTGVYLDTNGYAAFHNFYRYLLAHKKYVSGEKGDASSGDNALFFLNYKDAVKYRCVIQRFVLRRSADSPMLYNYSIQCRAYDLQPLDYKPELEEDKIKALGLDGVKSVSLFNKMKSASNAAKGIVGGITGGISVLGS